MKYSPDGRRVNLMRLEEDCAIIRVSSVRHRQHLKDESHTRIATVHTNVSMTIASKWSQGDCELVCKLCEHVSA